MNSTLGTGLLFILQLKADYRSFSAVCAVRSVLIVMPSSKKTVKHLMPDVLMMIFLEYMMTKSNYFVINFILFFFSCEDVLHFRVVIYDVST